MFCTLVWRWHCSFINIPHFDGMTDVHGAGQPVYTLSDVAKSSLKFGAFTGGLGFLFGGTSGILKGTTPFLFASASSIQTSILGTTFWATRSGILQAWDTGSLTASDYTKASTAAGGLSGAVIALLTRGRSNVIPATLMWSLSGCVGQIAINSYATPKDVPKDSFWKRMAEKKWSPMSFVSDEDYSKILQQKMLRLDAEIAVLDDKIAALKKEAVEEHSSQKRSDVP